MKYRLLVKVTSPDPDEHVPGAYYEGDDYEEVYKRACQWGESFGGHFDIIDA